MEGTFHHAMGSRPYFGLPLHATSASNPPPQPHPPTSPPHRPHPLGQAGASACFLPPPPSSETENCFSYDGETDGETEAAELGRGLWPRRLQRRRRRKRRNRREREEEEGNRRSRKTVLRPLSVEPPRRRRSLVSPDVPDEELISLLRYLDEGSTEHQHNKTTSSLTQHPSTMSSELGGNPSLSQAISPANSSLMASAASPSAASSGGDSGYDCCPASVGSSMGNNDAAPAECQQQPTSEFQRDDASAVRQMEEDHGGVGSARMFQYPSQSNAGDDLWDHLLRSIDTCSASDMQDLCRSFQGMEEAALDLAEEQHHHLHRGQGLVDDFCLDPAQSGQQHQEQHNNSLMVVPHATNDDVVDGINRQQQRSHGLPNEAENIGTSSESGRERGEGRSSRHRQSQYWNSGHSSPPAPLPEEDASPPPPSAGGLSQTGGGGGNRVFASPFSCQLQQAPANKLLLAATADFQSLPPNSLPPPPPPPPPPAVTTSSILDHQHQRGCTQARGLNAAVVAAVGGNVKQRTVGVVEPRVVVSRNGEQQQKVISNKSRRGESPATISNSSLRAGRKTKARGEDDDEKFENGKMGLSDSVAVGYSITKKLPPHFREALRMKKRGGGGDLQEEESSEGSSSSSEMTTAFRGRRKKTKLPRNKVGSPSVTATSSSFVSSEEEDADFRRVNPLSPRKVRTKNSALPWRLDLADDDDVLRGKGMEVDDGSRDRVARLRNPKRGKHGQEWAESGQGGRPNVNLRKLGHVGERTEGRKRNLSVGEEETEEEEEEWGTYEGNARRRKRARRTREQRKLHMTRPWRSGCIREEEEEGEDGKYGDGGLSAVRDGGAAAARDRVTRTGRGGGEERDKGERRLQQKPEKREHGTVPITMNRGCKKTTDDLGLIMKGGGAEMIIRRGREAQRDVVQSNPSFPTTSDHYSGTRLANKSISRTVVASASSLLRQQHSINEDLPSSHGDAPRRNNFTGNNEVGDELAGDPLTSAKAALTTIRDFDNGQPPGKAHSKTVDARGAKDALREGGALEVTHEYRDEWLFCAQCPPEGRFYTRKPERMARHKLFHTLDRGNAGNNKYVYKCPDCKKRFASLAKALKHDRMSHTEVPDYECRVCGQEVTDIKSHMKTHDAQKEFACDQCPMRFRHKNSLVRHQCQHTGERRYQCPRCDHAFIARHRLGEHLRKVHPEHREKVEEEVVKEEPEEKEELTKGCDNEVQIIETKERSSAKPQQPQQKTSSLSQLIQLPLMSTATIPVMSVVPGADGQMYLLPMAQTVATVAPQQNQQQQQLTIFGGGNSWLWNGPQQQQQSINVAATPATLPCITTSTPSLHSPTIPSPQPAKQKPKDLSQLEDTDFLDLAAAFAASSSSTDKSPNSVSQTDIVASALMASDVIGPSIPDPTS